MHVRHASEDAQHRVRVADINDEKHENLYLLFALRKPLPHPDANSE
jgi:hypothetical protein